MAPCWLIFVVLFIDVSHQSSTTSPATETTTPPPVQVRLAGDNRPPNAGRLEVYYNGLWGTVCDDSFDNRDARVACYMLGFVRSSAFTDNYFGGGSGRIWLDDVECSGSELSLAECKHRGWGVHNCGHNEDVSVVCDTNCSSNYPACETIWNTNPVGMYDRLVRGTLSINQLQSFCNAWNNCSSNLEDSGCTFADIFVQVVQHPQWYHFSDFTFDSLRHLCDSVYADFEIYQQCFQSSMFQIGGSDRCININRAYTYSPLYYQHSSGCWLLSALTSCYDEMVRQSCNTSAADNAIIALLYAQRIRISYMYIFKSCNMDIKEVVNNVTTVHVSLYQCDVDSFFYCAAQWPALPYVPDLRSMLDYGYLSPVELRSYCSRWNSFTSCINTTGCTFEDIYQHRLSLGFWSNYNQLRYNSTSTTYLHVCTSAFTEDYQTFYQCRAELDWYICDDIYTLKTYYDDYCAAELHSIACRYNLLKTGCNETITNLYLQFQWFSHVLQPYDDYYYYYCSQLMNTSLYEQITEDSDCSEFRYYTCLTQFHLLQDAFFGRQNVYSSLIRQANVSWTDILPLCTELNNLTACLGCSPEDQRFPGNSLHMRWHRVDSVTPLHLNTLCNGNSELTSTEPELPWYETTLPGTRSATTEVALNTVLPPRKMSVDSVWPLYGPVAGGTRVTITGQFLKVSMITAVYFGQHQGLIDRDSSVENTVFATTPPVNETTHYLVIELVLNDGSWIDTNHTFEYRGNPVFNDIRPRDHLTSGGTEVTVTGSNLNSVAEPRITLTVVITWFYDNYTNSVSSTNETESKPCKLPQANADGSEMLCRMPEVTLPDELSEYLERNESEKARHRRSSTDGPGVAAYVSSDGSVRADIYIRLILDGFKRYQNISSVKPDIKMQFELPPNIFCKSDNLDFDPSKRKIIKINGRHMRRGCREVDYGIRLGVAECVLVSLTDNQLEVRPPINRPERHVSDTFCHGDTLSLQIMIGDRQYQCYCVNYLPQYNVPLIVGLTVGLLLIIIIVVIIIVVLCRRRKTKLTRQKESKDDIKTSKDLTIEDKDYSKEPSDGQQKSTVLDVFDHQFSKQLPDELGEFTDNSGSSKDLNNEDRYYSRQLPDDQEESTELDVFNHNQYSKQLPDEHEESTDNSTTSEDLNNEDGYYSRRLPSDQEESTEFDILDHQYCKQLLDELGESSM